MIFNNNFFSYSFCIFPKFFKNFAIQSFRENEYNSPIFDQLLSHIKCTFLYIYDGAIFDGSH